MASQSFGAFEYNLVDVQRLIESHGALSGTGQGRRGLGHITRSGVVMLCAAWELYLEHVLVEGLRFGVAPAGGPGDVPKPVQKQLSRIVKEHKNELKPLELAGEGWRAVLLDHAESKVNSLNTPKAGPVNQLFNKLLGVEELSACWNIGADAVDEFVSARGDIAHRGRHAAYVRIWQLDAYRNSIRSAAIDTDNRVAEHIRDNFPVNRKPWNVTA